MGYRNRDFASEDESTLSVNDSHVEDVVNNEIDSHQKNSSSDGNDLNPMAM